MFRFFNLGLHGSDKHVKNRACGSCVVFGQYQGYVTTRHITKSIQNVQQIKLLEEYTIQRVKVV